MDQTLRGWLHGILFGLLVCWRVRVVFDAAKGYKPRIRMGSLDRDIVQRVALLLGCTVQISKTPKGKSFYIAALECSRAAAWMMTIYKFMGIRRKARIKEVLLKWRNHGV